jgi:formate hydrogenlyase subunit 6/NADH:ubiquinone oxidoreductase subunit I
MGRNEGVAVNASILSSLVRYFSGAYREGRSFFISCFTALPYLFSVGDLRKEVTEQYPDPVSSRTADDLPPRTRGLLFNDIGKCTGCKACEVSCPTKCIHIETEPGEDASKTWVSVFKIDYSLCVFCGLCVDVCEPQSLVHTKKYEESSTDLRKLARDFGRGEITPEQRVKWAKTRKQRESDGMPL